MSVYNNTNFRPSPDQGTPPPSPPTVQHEKDSNLPLNGSFAESTFLEIDKPAAKRLELLKKEITASTIVSWLGGKRRYLDNRGSGQISVRDARLINEYSKKPIFKVSENHLLELKVIDAARKTLESLNETHNFEETSKLLGLKYPFLASIKNGNPTSISIENARKIDRFFKTDVFHIHDIFDRACSESIKKIQTVFDSSEFTIIEFHPQRKKAVYQLDPTKKTKISEIVGRGVYRDSGTLSIRNAFVINQISGSEIFSFSDEKLIAVPLSETIRNRITELLKKKSDAERQTQAQISEALKTDRRILNEIKNGIQKKILFVTADRMNTYFGEPLFDFKQILNEAELDALRFYESTQAIDPPDTQVQSAQTSTRKSGPQLQISDHPQKRKTRDAEAESQPSKKQKTDPSDSRDGFSDLFSSGDDSQLLEYFADAAINFAWDASESAAQELDTDASEYFTTL